MKSLIGTALAMGVTTAALAGEPATFDINFEGGSVAKWVAAVQAEAPQSNIMVHAGDGSILMPALSLHNVTVQTCVQLVRYLPGADCFEVGGDSPGESVWVIDAGANGGTGPQAHWTRARGRTTHTTSVDGTAVFQIPAAYRDQDGLIQLMDAIESVCLLGGGQMPKVAMMPDVGLIAVNGSAQQLGACSELLSRIPSRHGSPATSEQDAAESATRGNS